MNVTLSYQEKIINALSRVEQDADAIHAVLKPLYDKVKRLEDIVAETKLCMKNIVNEESQYAYRKVIMGNGIAHCTDILAMIEALDRDTGRGGGDGKIFRAIR